MIKNTMFNVSLIASLALMALPAYSHTNELPHTHTGIEYIPLLLLAGIIALRLIKK